MVKRLLTIIYLNSIFSGVVYSQCLSKDYSTPIFDEVRKNFEIAKNDTLELGEKVIVKYLSKDEFGNPSDKGDLVLLKQNNKFEFYQIGTWIRFDKGKVLGKYSFDSCGFCYREVFYEHLDSVKTSEVTRSYITIDNKKVELEIIQNFGTNTETFDSYLIVNGKRKHHGLSRTLTNGVVTYERAYEFGKIKK